MVDFMKVMMDLSLLNSTTGCWQEKSIWNGCNIIIAKFKKKVDANSR